MGRPKKDPALVRSVPLNFRVTQPVKDAIDTMVTRRAAETGDDSLTGWFLAMVHREAKRQDIAIQVTPEAPAKPAPAKRRAPSKAAPKRKATGAGRSAARGGGKGARTAASRRSGG